MKKVLILFLVLCATFAQASTYKYLVFTNTAGTTTAFGVNNLTLTIDGSQLQVTSADGSVNIALIDLTSMQFSADGTTALEKVIDADAPVQVYSISGASLGTYESMLEAAKSLHAGSYVISNGNQSQIIVIK